MSTARNVDRRELKLEQRRTARVVLLDAEDRVLLMEISNPPSVRGAEPATSSLWVTLGGGVEPGESILEAARRELFEETGLEAAQIVRAIWHGRQILESASGERLLDETFVLARTSETVPQWRSHHWTPEEKGVVRGLRWWTIGELDERADVIKPPGLAGLLKELLSLGLSSG